MVRRKRGVVTAAIAKIRTDELGKTQPVRVDAALKGFLMVYKLLLPVVSLVLAARFAYVVRVPWIVPTLSTS